MPIIYPADVLTDEENLEFLESRIRHLIHLHNLISHWRLGRLGSVVESVETPVVVNVDGLAVFGGTGPYAGMPANLKQAHEVADGNLFITKSTLITEATPVQARAVWDALPQRIKDAQGPHGNPLFPRLAAVSPLPEERFTLFMNRFWDRWFEMLNGELKTAINLHDPAPPFNKPVERDVWVERKMFRRANSRWPFDDSSFSGVE